MATRTAGESAPGRVARRGLRPEIQALRAVAVGLVVVFHLWPGRLTGGFVGVDVFFVVSGYLISGHILRSLDAGRFSFREFYVRRARRLLPAACLVLSATALAVLAVLPYSRWRDSLLEILASALYVQNWVLAAGGGDYFAGEGTAAQHYWSLSVEEQFYLVWPLLLVALTWWAARAGGGRRRVALGLAAVTAASFTAGVWATAVDPSAAYFVTWTRVWEFSAGALLALAPVPTAAPRLRALASWAGVGAVVVAALVYDEATPFPGTAALLPVVGALLVIGAGLPPGRWSTARLAGWRPVAFVGDISYSLYLWHWPLIVVVPVVLGPGGLLQDAGVLVACLLLAWTTKVLVEDRWRDGPVPAPTAATAAAAVPAPRRRPDRAVLLLLASCLVLSGTGAGFVLARQAQAEHLERVAASERDSCFGAGALARPGCEAPFGDALVPDVASALTQFAGSPEHERCFVDVLETGVKRCTDGPQDADVHVALVGDSHALQWYPALQEVAERNGWRTTTYLRGSCPVALAVTVRPDDGEEALCDRWSEQVVDEVSADPSVDVVLTTAKNNKTFRPDDGGGVTEQAGVRGFAEAWSRFSEADKRVVVLRDTPRPRDHVLDCLAWRDEDRESCGRSRTTASTEALDPIAGEELMVEAVRRLDDPRVTLADPRDLFCTPQRCEAVIGNVVVYVDDSHMSPTYARTLAPWLHSVLDQAVDPA